MYRNASNTIDLVPQGGATPPARLVYLEPVSDAPSQTSSHGLPELWELIRARKLTVCTVVAVVMLAAAVYTFTQTPRFVASTTVELRGPNDAVGMPDAAAERTDELMQTQIRILGSKSLKRSVESALAAQNRQWSERPSKVEVWAREAGFNLGSPKETSGLPPAELTVQSFVGTRLLRIQCESTDPDFTALYANTAAQRFGLMQAESHVQAAQQASTWISAQIEEVREKLRKSESELQTFSKSTGRLNGPDQQSVDQTRLGQLEMELSRASADRVQRQSAFEVAAQNQAETVPQVADNDRLSSYTLKLSDLRRELAELRSTLTPEHYRVKRVEAQIRELESIARAERDNSIARIRNDYSAAARREQLLREAYVGQKSIVTQQAGNAVSYDLLKREVDSNRKLYDELLEKFKTASLSSAMTGSTVQVIDPAEVPSSPVQPTPFRNFVIAAISGLVGSILLIVASDHINRSLRSPGETPYYLGVPELGIIPELGRETMPATKSALNLSLQVVPGNGNGKALPAPQLQRFDSSLVAESFRSAVASILSSPQADGRQPQVILVTSSQRGDGKSSTVGSLGSTLAEINQRVLLIDADMRKPSLHNLFGVSNTWGLSNLLQEKTTLHDAPIESIARHTQFPDLYLLPSGPGTATIANLLYSPRLKTLVDRVRNDFDIILIDTPPMSYISDARVLGRLADGVVLVIRAGLTRRDEALAAKERLAADGTRLLGTILNAWDARSKSRYSYYRYGE